jgi:hypothetical protein
MAAAPSTRPARRSAGTLRSRPDLLVLAAILGATLVSLLYLGRDTIWVFDDWLFWFPGATYAPGDLLSHYNGHASVVNRLLSSLTITLTGGESYLPYRLAAYAMHLTTLALFYFVVAPRIGRGLALVALVPFTLMGLAGLHFYMPYSALFQGVGILGLLAALLALGRGTRRGDVVACVVLTVVTFWAAAGLAAVCAALAYLLWPPVQTRRLWVAGVPLVLFAGWYAAYRPDDGYGLEGLDDLSLIPGYVADGISHGLRAYTYLPQDWTVAMAVGVVALVVVLAVRQGAFDRQFVAILVGGVAFWAIIAVGRGPELRVDQVRYLYPDALHAVLIALAAAGIAGLRSDRRTVVVAGVLALAFFVPSLNQLRHTFAIERGKSVVSRAAITGAEIARDRAPDDFNPLNATRGDGEFRMDRYRVALADGRSAGFSEAEVLERGESVQQAVDRTIMQAAGLRAVATTERPRGCRAVATGEPFPVPFDVPVVVTNGGAEARLQLRRFADGGSELGRVPADGAVSVRLPRDRSARPWQGLVAGAGPLAVCGA